MEESNDSFIVPLGGVSSEMRDNIIYSAQRALYRRIEEEYSKLIKQSAGRNPDLDDPIQRVNFEGSIGFNVCGREAGRLQVTDEFLQYRFYPAGEMREFPVFSQKS